MIQKSVMVMALACTLIFMTLPASSFKAGETTSPVQPAIKQSPAVAKRGVAQAIPALPQSGAVNPAMQQSEAVANSIYSTRQNDIALAADGKEYALNIYKTLAIPNDPSASQAWVLNSATDKAWDVPRGNSQTLLAIVDTGFAMQHEELANRWFVNVGEKGPASTEAPSLLNCTARSLALDRSCNLIDEDGNGIVDDEAGTTTRQNPSRLNCSAQQKFLAKDCNNIDDDANSLIDDKQGWDFAYGDNSVQAGESSADGSGERHGTYVSGVAAATGNNNKGIAGVDWHTSILPIQVLDEDGEGYNVDVANGILYAAAQGADVISLSLGSDQADPLVREAVRVAIAAGSVVVAAAGNDGCDCMSYPANYPEVLAVGALANNGQPASFSSYGASLDIMAPGTGLYTTDWQPSNPTAAYASGIGGTSLSTPIVSGLLTRLKSQQPNATALQLIAALTENSDRLNIETSASRSNSLGFGRLDAGAASRRMGAPTTFNQIYTFHPVSFGSAINPTLPVQPSGQAMAYQCQLSRPGSTPIYELSKQNTTVFSASSGEAWQATTQGYTRNIFAYICLTQPHDQFTEVVRSISIHKEFRNILDYKGR